MLPLTLPTPSMSASPLLSCPLLSHPLLSPPLLLGGWALMWITWILRGTTPRRPRWGWWCCSWRLVQVEDWISHYLLELHQKGPTQVAGYFTFGRWITLYLLQEEVREVREEVRRFTPVNHLVWSTWAVLQVNTTSITITTTLPPGAELQYQLWLPWLRQAAPHRVPQAQEDTVEPLCRGHHMIFCFFFKMLQ